MALCKPGDQSLPVLSLTKVYDVAWPQRVGRVSPKYKPDINFVITVVADGPAPSGDSSCL